VSLLPGTAPQSSAAPPSPVPSPDLPGRSRASTFARIGRLSVRRRRLVLALSALAVVLAAVLGAGVFSELDAGGFEDPASESTRVTELVADRFGAGQADLVLLVDPVDGDVDSPVSRAAGEALGELISSDPDVAQWFSYWSLGGAPPLRSADGGTALVLVRTQGDDNARFDAGERIAEAARGIDPAVLVTPAGPQAVNGAVTHTIEADLARAEMIVVPITLVLLVLVFAGLVAAGLPLLIGGIAVLGTFFSLWAVAQVTDVSIFSINLVTALGLGLAIDYSLFIVSRFREELAKRPRRESAKDDRALVADAVGATVGTAGRTVAFSAFTVAVSLAALLVFPMYFLRSFAYAGIAVTLIAALGSLFTLPAVLATLGRRVDALSLRRSGGRGAAARARREQIVVDPSRGRWYRTARFVQRHAVPVAAGTVALLVLLGLPFTRVAFGVPDERVLPEGDPARVATERLRAEFATSEADAFPVVAASADPAVLGPIADQLRRLDDVDRVDGPVLEADTALFSMVPSVAPQSEEAERLVTDIRAISVEGISLQVGGGTAALMDTKSSILQRLPFALGWIALSTFVLLFLMFGSVVVPLKAMVLNLLSLSATFGAMVWVFQWGNGAELLGFTATGLTDISMPILMFCVAFGLSMDYEVFLLSRVHEEYQRTGDNATAVAVGLQRTGRIVTAAAAVLSVTFIAFATSDITFIKLFGLGLALAILMDASIVRGLLVPAFMHLAGEGNWWAPRWMRRVHDRYGISETGAVEVGSASDDPALEARHQVGHLP